MLIYCISFMHVAGNKIKYRKLSELIATTMKITIGSNLYHINEKQQFYVHFYMAYHKLLSQMALRKRKKKPYHTALLSYFHRQQKSKAIKSIVKCSKSMKISTNNSKTKNKIVIKYDYSTKKIVKICNSTTRNVFNTWCI